MISPICLKAIEAGLKHPKVILKYISRTDVGANGSNQCGYYLPKNQWAYFDTLPPRKGENRTHRVEIRWQDSFVTESNVKWYGTASRSEYRITQFGRGFPYLEYECVGMLLALVFERTDKIHAFVLESDDDIEAIQEELGLTICRNWGSKPSARQLTEDECLDAAIRRFVAELHDFPKTHILAGTTRDFLIGCAEDFLRSPSDAKLARLIDVEYRLFRATESHLLLPKVRGPFESMESFLEVAQSILQSRKSRAGKSLEHHVKSLLQDAGLPFDIQAPVEGKPDILIPGTAAYEDAGFPASKLFVLALKTTCKDRWRQVLQEAPRIPQKHLLTLQEGISENQLAEMAAARVTLVVPEKLHASYGDGAPALLSVERFIDKVRRAMAA